MHTQPAVPITPAPLQPGDSCGIYREVGVLRPTPIRELQPHPPSARSTLAARHVASEELAFSVCEPAVTTDKISCAATSFRSTDCVAAAPRQYGEAPRAYPPLEDS